MPSSRHRRKSGGFGAICTRRRMAHNLKCQPRDGVHLEEGVVDNSRAVIASVVGAVLGGVAGYLFFTERGRALTRQIEPALEDLGRELNHFRATMQKAAGVASEGWRLLNEAVGEEHPRYPSPHQSYPF